MLIFRLIFKKSMQILGRTQKRFRSVIDSSHLKTGAFVSFNTFMQSLFNAIDFFVFSRLVKKCHFSQKKIHWKKTRQFHLDYRLESECAVRAFSVKKRSDDSNVGKWKMSVLNTNALHTTIDASENLANETHLNDTTKISENRVLNENTKPRATITATTMPAATNPMNATVTVLNSNAPFPPSEHCSDSEEDFDRTTRNLGAHKWIFNYKDVSSTNPCPLFWM